MYVSCQHFVPCLAEEEHKEHKPVFLMQQITVIQTGAVSDVTLQHAVVVVVGRQQHINGKEDSVYILIKQYLDTLL